MGGGTFYGDDSDDESTDLRKAPSFMKIFDVQRNMESIDALQGLTMMVSVDLPTRSSIIGDINCASRKRDEELVLDVGSSEDYSTADESEDDFATELTS
ncbi:hypothetical protein SASPL_143316 [Salvia splendens]|uniref:Uncharacterized protein n=1 Tax=Salvia splendens TaxID=180675 RepID=A0A8X8Z9W5_SALSN|nr:hypothetical protein SASPL_143316 [Salvia splendens]